MQLQVAGSLELFENHVVHAATGINQGSGNDSQAAAFFDVSCGTEKALGALQSVGIHTP